jgi:hypothetical protein
LSTFAIEVSEDYEGDGFLVFRKGRNVLYKEKFDPDNMTTVATIPLEVLESVDVGDTVVWGVVFDDRRKKDVESRFKVVNRPKADKRLARIARDKHLARQPAVVKAMVAANALENYRLYSEALVACLEVLQDHPTAVQPYQGIVTCLRRLESKDSRLWGLASQHVKGSGRARAGRTGITAFAPQSAQPVTPPTSGRGDVAARPDKPRAPGAGDGVTPGLRPVPKDGSTPSPSPTTPSSPDVPPAPGVNEGDLAARVLRTAEEADQARQKADAAQGQADQAAAKAAEAEALAQAARRKAEEADDAARKAQQDFDEDPSAENAEALNAARKAREDADAHAGATRHEAEQARKEANAAETEAKRRNREADGLEAEARDAKRAAEEAGLDIPKPAPSAVKDPKRELDRTRAEADRLGQEYEGLKTGVAEAQHEVDRLETLLSENPDDGIVQQELQDAQAKLGQIEKEAARVREKYVEALGNLATKQSKVQPGTQKPADLKGLEQAVHAAETALAEADQKVHGLSKSLEEDPGNGDLVKEHEAAVEAREKARAALDGALEAYEAALE